MLKSYASYFTAFLLGNLKNKGNIIRIVLYGSAAKGEATKESDVDIFMEVKKKTGKFEDEIRQVEEGFYKSREASLFKAKGVENRFSIKCGDLKAWKELYRSIASTGVILYGPYEARELPSGTRHFIIVFWESIGRNRGSFLNKLYGFKARDKRYKGMLLKSDGRKLGKSCIMLPVQYKNDIFRLLRKHEVKANVLEVFT